MEQYKGAICNRDTWYLTDNTADLLAVDDSNVLWVTDRYSLQAALEERYPSNDSRLSRINDRGQYFDISDEPKSKCRTLDELMALAKELGKVQDWIFSWELHHHKAKLLENGFYSNPNHILYYNPKIAKRKLEKEIEKDQKSYVKLHELSKCLYGFASVLCKDNVWPISMFKDYNTRTSCIRTLHAAITMFNLSFKKTHGRNAYRKFGPFQEFVKKWRSKKAASNEEYRKSGFNKFSDFMDKMADSRLPKAIKESEWVIEAQEFTVLM